ncbi:unnamed protein product, partial [Meganyctiphanes norvegica]
QMSVKITCLVVLLALSACFTPAASQIHWNRGWGASGSNVGKRGGSANPMGDMALLDTAGCSLAITELADALVKLMQISFQSSVSDVVACHLGHRSSNAVSAH